MNETARKDQRVPFLHILCGSKRVCLLGEIKKIERNLISL